MTRILVVEDESNIATLLHDDLQIEGYEVEVARDGESALEMAKEQNFDLILLDIMLPGKDGYEVCRQLRREDVSIPLIMLTARGQEAEKVLGLELGADDYITKPFSPLELRARIKAVLRRTTQDQPQRYRFGDCEFDFLRFELRQVGHVVDLTPMECRLLATFIQHRGHLLSRDQILDLTWGEEVYVTDRAVDTQVSNLRRKIETDPQSPTYIISVRGLGYRFDG
ncbi:response regulator transcription factor [Gemmatimonadota bacterium]